MSGTVVIGAGPAGLTTAYELSKLGEPSTIIEADAQVGGISRTVDYRGYRFDIGGHRFFSKVPVINEIWHEILGDEFLLRPRLSRIYYRGRFFDYPLKATNALAGLGPVEAALMGLSYGRAKLFPARPEISFEHWVSNRFGSRLYETFFKTYTEKVWGIPCAEISADWAAQRIKNLSFIEAVRNSLFNQNGKTKDGKIITTLIDEFHYPPHGPGMMWERCEGILAGGGNETIHGIKVDTIRHRNGRVESVLGHSRAGEAMEFGGNHFVSTMPLRSLIRAMDPAPPDEVLRAANQLRYRDYLTVVLIINRADIFPDNWVYIHSPDVKMGRIQNYKNWSPQMVPDARKTSLGLEYFLWDQDEEWGWSDERLIDLGIQECAQLKLIEPGEVEDGTVVRMKKAYPIYDQNYKQNLEVVRRYIDGIPNLQTVGRNGQHRYNNQDHSMLTGVYAAQNIVGERHDVWDVNVDQEYHEEKTEEASAKTVSIPKTERMVPQRVHEPGESKESTADEILEAAFAKLDPVALGIAVALVGGIALFAATVILLLKGGTPVGPNLSLLGQYFIGFEVSWKGAFVGLVEAGIGGFLVGCVGASLRNGFMRGYVILLKRRADAEERKRMLEQV